MCDVEKAILSLPLIRVSLEGTTASSLGDRATSQPGDKLWGRSQRKVPLYGRNTCCRAGYPGSPAYWLTCQLANWLFDRLVGWMVCSCCTCPLLLLTSKQTRCHSGGWCREHFQVAIKVWIFCWEKCTCIREHECLSVPKQLCPS